MPTTYVDPFGLDYIPPGSYGHGGLEFLNDGAKIDAWIADFPGPDLDDPSDDFTDQGIGCNIPENADIDFFLIDGVWYKIKNGKVFIQSDGEGNSRVLPCSNCSIFEPSVYPIDRPDPFWRAMDGNAPENHVNDRSLFHENKHGTPLPHTPVPVPPWPGLRNLF